MVTCCLRSASLTPWQAGTQYQAPQTASGLGGATNTLPAFAQPPSYTAESAWPESTLPEDTTLGFPASANSVHLDHQAWNQGVPVSFSAAHTTPAHSQQFAAPPIGPGTLPPRLPRHPSAPAIIIPPNASQFSHEPQDFSQTYSATSASSNSPFPLREAASYPSLRNQHFHPGHLSPNYMAEQPLPEAADLQTAEMQTTTPPRSPFDMTMGEPPMSRKRSASQISTDGPQYPPLDGSHQGSQMGDDFAEPGRINISRPEPRLNDQKKFLCNFDDPGCAQLVFDRKCEWR